MDSTDRHLKCVVVTPERACLDEVADFVALPMFDGELGVLPGRAALIGRLGYGELRLAGRMWSTVITSTADLPRSGTTS